MINRLDDAHIDMVLHTQHIGRLACCRSGQPYVVPITYVYRDGYVYGHTNEGEKISIMRENPLVCFEVDQIQDMLRWRSVIAKGEFEELTGAAAAAALDLLCTRLADYVRGEKSFPKEGDEHEEVLKRIRMKPAKGVVYRIRLTEKAGRYERI
jgi:nitroimidazol reductase NimA-like FMN-containing flavoprotein (pyridoxamine 5'-phosphate oxidase superfamily)